MIFEYKVDTGVMGGAVVVPREFICNRRREGLSSGQFIPHRRLHNG